MARDNLAPVLLGVGGIAALYFWFRSRSGVGVTSNAYDWFQMRPEDNDLPAPIRDEVLPVKLDTDSAVQAASPTFTPPIIPMPSLVVNPLLPKGIRLNNPGNIEKNASNQWAGMAADQSADPRYVTFSQPIYGIRALAYIVYRSYAGRGLNTIRKIIGAWAPPGENNTAAYIAHVSQLTGLGADTVVPAWGIPLIAAIITHENGRQPYALATIAQGINMARS